MHCTQCGSVQDDDAKFCTECGADIEEAAADLHAQDQNNDAAGAGPATPLAATDEPKKTNTALIIGIAIAATIVLCIIAGYFIVSNLPTKQTDPVAEQQQNEASEDDLEAKESQDSDVLSDGTASVDELQKELERADGDEDALAIKTAKSSKKSTAKPNLKNAEDRSKLNIFLSNFSEVKNWTSIGNFDIANPDKKIVTEWAFNYYRVNQNNGSGTKFDIDDLETFVKQYFGKEIAFASTDNLKVDSSSVSSITTPQEAQGICIADTAEDWGNDCFKIKGKYYPDLMQSGSAESDSKFAYTEAEADKKTGGIEFSCVVKASSGKRAYNLVEWHNM